MRLFPPQIASWPSIASVEHTMLITKRGQYTVLYLLFVTRWSSIDKLYPCHHEIMLGVYKSLTLIFRERVKLL